MSITISNCNEICHSPTNQSKAKMLYTFSKSSRFPKRRRILCDKFYQHSSSVSPSRTTTFGFGNKYQFTKDVPNTPPPNTYNLKSEFQNFAKKGFGFGQGRDQMQVTGPLVSAISNKNPGPGSYKLPSTLCKSAFTIGARNSKEDKQKKQVPGPGAYPVVFCINQKGSYFLAKFKNSCARNFSRLPSRAATAQKVVPGPGAYDISHQLMSPDGKYVTSKMQNSLVRRFGTALRSHLNTNKETPGPGNYKLPSQFGHYVSKECIRQSSLSPKKAIAEDKENNA